MGETAGELKRVAPHFVQYRDDFRQAERNVRRKGRRQ
jgi:hypothetical protein